jgi:hypothetical protein
MGEARVHEAVRPSPRRFARASQPAVRPRPNRGSSIPTRPL